ncbi:MAG TPA: hypothetical protein VJ914_22575 [Pseudonocardiaceae bacterium]|nr:hypothetical protein [Pseudonocardiaceae bacterium]
MLCVEAVAAVERPQTAGVMASPAVATFAAKAMIPPDEAPGRWRMLITRTRRCVVLIAAIGLYPESGERPFTWLTTLLKQAADAGELVGGLVETGWTGNSDSRSSS